MSTRIGVDVGGTLTNLILFDESSGKMTVAKGRSTPSRPDVGVLSGVDDACTGTTVPDAHYFLHGTTVGINALLERKGASWAC